MLSLQWPNSNSSSTRCLLLYSYQIFLFPSSVVARTYFIVLNCYQIKKSHDIESSVHYCSSLLEGKEPKTENLTAENNTNKKT